MVKSLFGVAIAWIVIVGGSMLFLQINSRPWSERQVPALLSLSADEAFDQLIELGLVPIHLDSVYSSSAIPGTILEQSPSAGSSVKSGRPVYLTTYRITPPDESITVYEGQDATLAKSILIRKGFEVIETTEPNLILKDKVIRVLSKGTLLSPEDRRVRGSKIQLVIGSVVEKRVRIPWLLGLRLVDVVEQLSNASLSLGYVEYGDSVLTPSDTIDAIVTKQFPSSSVGRVNAGTSIDVKLKRP